MLFEIATLFHVVDPSAVGGVDRGSCDGGSGQRLPGPQHSRV